MSRRIRPLLAVLTVVCAAAAATIAGSQRAGAAPATVAPDEQAWWNVSNAGPAAPPPPPGVNGNDLFTAGSKGDQSVADPTASAPSPFTSMGDKGAASAIAAVRYTIPEGAAVDRLVLKFDGNPPQSVSIAACRVTSAGGRFTAELNGPWTDVPPYDCTVPSLGSFSSDGSALQFTDVGALAQGNVLSVVIVAQVLAYSAFLPPGPDSLVLRPAPLPFDSGGSTTPAFSEFNASTTAPGATAPYVPPAALPPAANAPAPPVTAPAPARTPGTRQSIRPAAALPGLDDARARLAAAIALAAVLAAFAWMLTGDTPALRRSLAARLAGPGVTLPQPEVSRGLGRFRRVRSGRPPQV